MPDALPPYPTTEFADWVRDALAHLYDVPYLQAHPLAILLAEGQEGPLQRTQRLRRALLDCIHAMRPPSGVPASSPDWRHYRLLELRYIEAMPLREVMQGLALSRSQFFREQAAVLDTLVGLLWRTLGVQAATRGETDEDDQIRDEEAPAGSVKAALDRLTARASWDEVALSEVVGHLGRIIEPLARERDVHLTLIGTEHLPVVVGDRVLVRQALLDVLTCALERGRGGEIALAATSAADSHGIRVTVRGAVRAMDSEIASEDGGALSVCRELVGSMGGSVILSWDGEAWCADLFWPRREPILLAVDDNADFIDLYRRYLGPHGWRVVGAESAQEARRVLHETHPTVILLDVLMPNEDGWELLLSLREDPTLDDIPVIICSVLDQSHLASSLGAAGYLKKPVSQQDLAALLARWYRSRPNPVTAPER